MLKNTHIPNSLLPCVLTILLSVIVGFLIISGQKAGIALALLPFIAWLGVRDKKYSLYFFFLIMPFYNIPFFSKNLMGLTGAKPFNLIASFTFAMFFFSGGSLLKNEDLIEKKSMIFLTSYFVIFSVAVFRSLGYLQTLVMFGPDKFHRSPMRYLLSEWVRPALFIIPFFYILKHIRTEEDIQRCIDIICYSIFMLSCAVVIVGLLNIKAITAGRGATNDVISKFFGMHYNSVGSIYIIVAPLLVRQVVIGKRLSVANFVLSSVAVALLQSRSAIIVFLSGIILTLYFLKKRIIMLSFIGLSALIFICWLPGFLIRTLSTGIEKGDMNSVLTGRVDKIWLPLLMERFHNLRQLFLGVGRFSMMNSPRYRQGYILQANSAHNAFIEFFVDNGLIIFSLVMVYLVFFLKKAWSLAKELDSPLAWVLFVCLLNYLAGTISGRKIYPDHHNMHLFPIIAMYINLIRLKFQNTESE